LSFFHRNGSWGRPEVAHDGEALLIECTLVFANGVGCSGGIVRLMMCGQRTE